MSNFLNRFLCLWCSLDRLPSFRSQASNLPAISLTTSRESQYITMYSPLNSSAERSPTMRASYSVSLLVAGYASLTPNSTRSSFPMSNTTLILLACWLDDPSTWIFHGSSVSALDPEDVCSTMKSAITCLLMASVVDPRYQILRAPLTI